jgi:tRNA dimethylallyltransferase
MKADQNTPTIIIYGPTGTGKTDFAEALARKMGASIINMDVGQLYSKLSIGTAKPEWKKSGIDQYLFDSIDDPINPSATKYRQKVSEIVTRLSQKNKPCVIVGGTGFYLYNLLFSNAITNHDTSMSQYKGSWEDLKTVDQKRAKEIHPNDSYRIQRALAIFYNEKKIPSECKPVFDPIAPNIIILSIERDKEDLVRRIEQRVQLFLDQGWIKEVQGLMEDGWTEFLIKKKFIGYQSIITMINENKKDIAAVKKEIIQETMHYVKRQKTFWRGLFKKITAVNEKEQKIACVDLNLTFMQVDLYLNQFLKKIISHE